MKVSYEVNLPSLHELSPDTRYLMWRDNQKAIEKANQKARRSWLATLLLSAPAIAFIGLKPVNDAFGIIGYGLQMMDRIGHIFPDSHTQSAAVDDPKIMAFLDTIAWAEGTGDRYDLQYTFAKFAGFTDHPRKVQCAGGLCSDASGRYQFLSTTWDGQKAALGLPDFSPASQDKAAIAQLKTSGAYQKILAGDVRGASCMVGKIWASFPCNNYDQPQKSAGSLEQIYQEKLAARSGQAGQAAIVPGVVSMGMGTSTGKEFKLQPPKDAAPAAVNIAKSLGGILGIDFLTNDLGTMSAKTFPLAGDTWETAAKTSPYGDRIHPITGAKKMHWGQDFGAPQGQPVLATEAGVVEEVKRSASGCGNEITLKFADGTGARYCHLASVSVAIAQQVRSGEVIGEVGSTGDSTAPHLHFERIVDGASVDPIEYLKN